MRSLRVAFVVQGEGRGHMTQALALARFLREAGHEVGPVLVGASPWRSVPGYFFRDIGAEVETYEAPTHVPDKAGRAFSARRSLIDVARRGRRLRHSVARIADATRRADVVVNFLDILGGIARRGGWSSAPTLAVAHNHLFRHPALEGVPGPWHLRRAVLGYARATAAGARRTLALSFAPMPGHASGTPEVVPPLLRPGLEALEPARGDYLLAYVLNAGHGAELAAWSAATGTLVHCYLDGGKAGMDGSSGRADPLPETFHAHDLDQDAFLRHLAGCRAFIGSAGFESICEAHWLGKPVLAVPTKGQFEQTLNAWDAERCGAAIAGSWADVGGFWKMPSDPDPDRVASFRAWVGQAAEVHVEAVERTARAHRSR